MKMKWCMIMAAAMGILVLSTFANATQIQVTDASFTNLRGNTTGFTWSVTPVTNIAAFNLAAGQNTTFTYGTFSTTDFNNAKKIDDDESFTASFFVTPPGATQQESEVLKAIKLHGNDYLVQIDVDNTLSTILFGNGGKYTLAFLDPAELYSSGSVPLQATISLLSDSTDLSPTGSEPGGSPAPVPEPGSVILVAAGLAGLTLYRKVRKAA